MGKHKEDEYPIIKESPKSPEKLGSPSLVDPQLEVAKKFIYDVLRFFDDIHKILEKKDK